jgi:hypothetical protein
MVSYVFFISTYTQVKTNTSFDRSGLCMKSQSDSAEINLLSKLQNLLRLSTQAIHFSVFQRWKDYFVIFDLTLPPKSSTNSIEASVVYSAKEQKLQIIISHFQIYVIIIKFHIGRSGQPTD